MQKQIDELAQKLLEYHHAYYVLGRPIVSDLEYDRLFDRLKALEEERPELKRPWSPTVRVGSDLSSDFPEVKHSVPVLSLDKAYSVSELNAWIEKTNKNAARALTFTVEQKMDGVSIVLYYENGILDKAVTRGNGSVGNDVTANVKTIGSVPLKLASPVTMAVRGEIFLPKSKFESINATLEEPYANARNLAAGTLRRIKSKDVAQVPLHVFFYEAFVRSTGTANRVPKGHVESMLMLQDLGFPVNPHLGIFAPEGAQEAGFEPAILDRVRASTMTLSGHGALEDFVRAQTSARSTLDWEMDGLVLKVDDLALREELGYTGHHPRWALAFKFESPQGQTTVEDVFVQVGRTGRVTPVARVKPVAVGGSTITFVTLHNAAYVESLELGVSDVVTISRRGDVIPAVENVVEKLSERTWEFPRLCPSCRTELVRDGAHHFCPNDECPDQLLGRLSFFVGKGQMDIENLGPETLQVLFERNLVRDPSDLFTCDYDLLLDVPGFGEKKVRSIREGVESAKTRSFETVLVSLGIPDLGKKMAELLVSAGYRSWSSIVDVFQNDPQSLLAIAGIGEKTIETLGREVLSDRYAALMEKLARCGLSTQAEAPQAPASDAFAGTSWCVTGSFEAFQPRSLAEDEIKKRSGKVVSAVSGNTTHLLAGQAAGSKLQKAQALGIAVVTESEFVELLRNHPLSSE